ncbi:MAG TPA: LLM class flavin-dependent oxidoreductase [Ktedonosporobacter sp.]|jgi:probable F420-dependent oxidoreductase|nr:LLM class flavin-dependent oxidoreductase [Ktedonosporobacter sp.]
MTQSPSENKMKIGVVLDTSEGGLQGKTPTFQELREMAQAAEHAGLDSLWLCDHLIYRFPQQEETGIWEVFTMLSALAAVTTQITLGTIVICTSFRPPAMVAKMADTLDEISGGRLILGLGAGWHQPEYEAFGYPFDHLAGRFEEAMQIIAPLLREGRVDFQGQYYQVHNCVLRPRGPSRNGPPILIAGRRPRMLQLTARYADAWNTAWHMEPEVVKERYDGFKEACTAAGRDPAAVELTVGTSVKLLAPGEDAGETKVITGTPEEIARRLHSFAGVGTAHLIVTLDPISVASIEQFGHIVELIRQL